MRILINDANILIDLIRLACVDAFFKLDAEVSTTDFVLEELEIEQQLIFQNFNFRVLTSDCKYPVFRTTYKLEFKDGY
jgi:hypothetical protein